MADLPPPEPPVYPPAGPRWPEHPPTQWPPPQPRPPPPGSRWWLAVPVAVLVLLVAVVVIASQDDEATLTPVTNPPPTTAATSAPPPQGARVTVGLSGPVRTVNPHRADLDADVQAAAVAVAEQVFPSAFTHLPDGTWRMETVLLAGAEVTATAPFTVTYRLAPGAAWSDGIPIGCDDFTLAWNAISGRVPSFSTARTDVPVDRNPDTATYSAIAGVDCAPGTVTVRFSRSVAEWRMLFAHLLPAHAVAAVAGVPDLAGALAAGDLTRLAPVARVWDDGFGPGLDDRLRVSGGPFRVSEVRPSGEAYLERNPAYGGPPPALAGLVVRPFPDASGLLAALRRGAVQVAVTGPDEDVYRQLQDLAGYQVEAGTVHAYAELSFVFPRDGGLGPGEAKVGELAVRQAIARCVDRAALVADLVAPFVPRATTADSHLLVPGEPGYTPYTGGVARRDLAAARAGLEAAGWQAGADGVYAREGQRLALLLTYRDLPRQRRAAEAIAAQCAEAGIEIRTVSQAPGPPGGALRLQSWGPFASVEAQLTRFEDDGLLNNSSYANPALVPAFDAVRAAGGDVAAMGRAAAAADAQLWDDVASVPLYPLVGLTIWDERLCGVEPNPTTLGIAWNARSWQPCPTPGGGGGGVP